MSHSFVYVTFKFWNQPYLIYMKSRLNKNYIIIIIIFDSAYAKYTNRCAIEDK